jgi:hypothetical protein
LETYDKSSTTQKAELLERFAKDRSCKWVTSVTESRVEGSRSEQESYKGWMTKWDLAGFLCLPPNLPMADWDKVMDAAVDGLPKREHENPMLGRIGVLQYDVPFAKKVGKTTEGIFKGRTVETYHNPSAGAMKMLGEGEAPAVKVKIEYPWHTALLAKNKEISLFLPTVTRELTTARKLASSLKVILATATEDVKNKAESFNEDILTASDFEGKLMDFLARSRAVPKTEEAECVDMTARGDAYAKEAVTYISEFIACRKCISGLLSK